MYASNELSILLNARMSIRRSGDSSRQARRLSAAEDLPALRVHERSQAHVGGGWLPASGPEPEPERRQRHRRRERPGHVERRVRARGAREGRPGDRAAYGATRTHAFSIQIYCFILFHTVSTLAHVSCTCVHSTRLVQEGARFLRRDVQGVRSARSARSRSRARRPRHAFTPAGETFITFEMSILIIRF